MDTTTKILLVDDDPLISRMYQEKFALKLLKEKKEPAPIPVIILSSIGGDFTLIEKAKKLGVVDTITKGDISPKEVAERVKKMLADK
jgi:PleD family two-component response regulator